MNPPRRSALDLYRVPKTLPILIPAAEKRKVMQPIQEIAGRIFTERKAKVTPTARASMLVAIAKSSIVVAAMEQSASSAP